MNLHKSVVNYVDNMLNVAQGMKVLLLDQETTPMISVVISQSYLLGKEVFLVDRVENKNRDKMRHLKCISFVRPSSSSIQAILRELKDPCYGEYFLFFSNMVKKSDIERLAEADEQEMVKEVQEFFIDYCAINPDFFSLNIDFPLYPAYSEDFNSWNGDTLNRTVEGLGAVLLSLKKKPIIRYEKNSILAERLTHELQHIFKKESQLFDFRKTDTPPVLLILDRKNDPVTPLLMQWSYQAMVHELLTIDNGRVDLSKASNISPDLKEVVLSYEQDPFYQKNMYLNLGDLGVNIKSYVDEYQAKTQSNMNIESIADMKRFVEEYPEFKKLAGNVSKHVTLVSELSRLVKLGNLMDLSQVEQSLACTENHSVDLKTIQEFIQTPQISDDNKIKLVMLYALRYERTTGNETVSLIDMMQRNGVSPEKIKIVNVMLKYAGAERRQGDLFLNEDLFSRGKNVFKGLKGVENVYTQHEPFLMQIIGQMMKGKLKDNLYPFADNILTREKPQDLVIYIIGGATFEEARFINQFNNSMNGVRIMLGGPSVLNSSKFLLQVCGYKTSSSNLDVSKSI